MADWSQRDDDFDANASFVIYAGKACEEVKTRMQHGPLEVVEDLRHMPEAAFEFYLKCFLEALIADDYPHDMRGVAMFAACQLLHEKVSAGHDQTKRLAMEFLPLLKPIAHTLELSPDEVEAFGSFVDAIARVDAASAASMRVRSSNHAAPESGP